MSIEDMTDFGELTPIQRAKRNAELLRTREYQLALLSQDRAMEILQEPLDKDTRPVIASLYKDIMARHVTHPEKLASDQEIATQKLIDVTPPPRLSYEELRLRAIDALKSEEESDQIKAKLIASQVVDGGK